MDPVFYKSAKNGSFFINTNILINGRIYTPEFENVSFSKKQSIKPTLLAALAAGGGADVLFAASAMSCWCWL